MNKINVYNNEYNKNEFDKSSDKTKFVIDFVEKLTKEVDYKEFNFEDVFNYFFENECVDKKELILVLFKYQLFSLLDMAQSKFKLELSYLLDEKCNLNKNHAKDKKILINTDVINNMIDLRSVKNIQEIIVKLIPFADKPLIEKIISIIKKDNSMLIDFNLLHIIYIYSCIVNNRVKLVELLDNHKLFDNNKRQFLIRICQLGELIKNINYNSKFNIISSLLDSYNPEINLNDFLLEYERVKKAYKINFKNVSIKNFHDLHSYVSVLYRKILENGDNIVFEPNKMFTNIEQINQDINYNDAHKIRLPRDSYELINWGEQLNNCIASYNEKFLKQDCVLMGIFDKNNKIKFAIEYIPSEDRIVQFVGKNNIVVEKYSLVYVLVEKLLSRLKRTYGFQKRSFNYIVKKDLSYPETNDDFLFKFGFLNKVDSNNAFFNKEWCKYGIDDSISGLIVLDDKYNVIQNHSKDSLEMNEFVNSIKMKKDKFIIVNYKNLYINSDKMKYKRDLSINDIVLILNEIKKEEKTLVLIHDLSKTNLNYKLVANYIIKITKFHVTDESVSVNLFPSIKIKDDLVFEESIHCVKN